MSPCMIYWFTQQSAAVSLKNIKSNTQAMRKTKSTFHCQMSSRLCWKYRRVGTLRHHKLWENPIVLPPSFYCFDSALTYLLKSMGIWVETWLHLLRLELILNGRGRVHMKCQLHAMAKSFKCHQCTISQAAGSYKLAISWQQRIGPREKVLPLGLHECFEIWLQCLNRKLVNRNICTLQFLSLRAKKMSAEQPTD